MHRASRTGPGRLVRLGTALVLAAIGASVAAAPAAGRYRGTLCVAASDQPRSCGPAEVDIRPGGAVDVRVSDIVYRLQVRSGKAAVIVMHGTMQIDEFNAGAEWSAESLRFADDEKRVRYEVRVEPARAPAK
ncbi:MAG: hypothetical protein ABIV63_10460 [Caldimonas sp.]